MAFFSFGIIYDCYFLIECFQSTRNEYNHKFRNCSFRHLYLTLWRQIPFLTLAYRDSCRLSIYILGRASGLNDKQPKKVIPVAVKALKDEASKEQKEEFYREVTLMSILTHPNIVQLLAVSTEEEPYGMLFEFMSGGDLNQYLRNALPAETSLESSEKGKGRFCH